MFHHCINLLFLVSSDDFYFLFLGIASFYELPLQNFENIYLVIFLSTIMFLLVRMVICYFVLFLNTILFYSVYAFIASKSLKHNFLSRKSLINFFVIFLTADCETRSLFRDSMNIQFQFFNSLFQKIFNSNPPESILVNGVR